MFCQERESGMNVPQKTFIRLYLYLRESSAKKGACPHCHGPRLAFIVLQGYGFLSIFSGTDTLAKYKMGSFFYICKHSIL